MNEYFKFEKDLLKHHVRTQGWLPCCQKRLAALGGRRSKQPRRLRYFTFCAVGAIDVLMLDVAKVLHPSDGGKFDTVVFFDRTPDAVDETQKNIPGAIGFPGDFSSIVLLHDPDEDTVIDAIEVLNAPATESDTAQTQRQQTLLAQRQRFIQCFPFDIINLDLEEFLLKPNDPIPGRIINALRHILNWQKRSLPPRNIQVESFCLMFTTQIGPPNLGDDYLGMLENYLIDNMRDDPDLLTIFQRRTGVDNPRDLRGVDFSEFFRLAMPKALASTVLEEDWFIDPQNGITIFEFDRPSSSGPYKILHLVMDLVRQRPPRERRAPGTVGAGVRQAYQTVARQVLSNREIHVSETTIDADSLKQDLNKIFARRKKYFEGTAHQRGHGDP